MCRCAYYVVQGSTSAHIPTPPCNPSLLTVGDPRGHPPDTLRSVGRALSGVFSISIYFWVHSWVADLREAEAGARAGSSPGQGFFSWCDCFPCGRAHHLPKASTRRFARRRLARKRICDGVVATRALRNKYQRSRRHRYVFL